MAKLAPRDNISGALREMAGRMSMRGLDHEADILRRIAEEVCDHRLMTLQEAAAFCRMSTAAFSRLVDDGEIECRWFGSEPRFDVRQLLP